MTKKETINVLYVDDDNQNLVSFKGAFRRDFNIFTALSAKEAETILDNENEIHVLITDQRMPLKTGTELLADAVKKYPKQIRILLTAFIDNKCLVDAINLGQAFRYMEKPWNHDKLKKYIEDAYDMYKEDKEQEERIILLERTNEELKIALNKKNPPQE